VPVPEIAVSGPGDLWLCGNHRALCGDATNGTDVASLIGDCKPILMVTDPPYGIELDSEWHDLWEPLSAGWRIRDPCCRHWEREQVGQGQRYRALFQ